MFGFLFKGVNKMIKIFIPQDKRQGKTRIRGFWYSKDNHKIYYDYLKIKNYAIPDQIALIKKLEALKKYYNQEAIFYASDNIGYCYYTRDNIEVLTNRIYTEVLRANLKQEIKEALRDFSGCTIYNEAGKYYIEIYYK